MSKFCEVLTYLIFEEGMDAKTFAKKIGVDPTCITRYQRGDIRPSVENLIKLADYFNCSTNYLIGSEDKNALTFKTCPSFSERFKYILKVKNKTCTELAEKTGIHLSSIYAWKNGRRLPTFDNLLKLAEILDCRIDYILGRES